jgi:hypothetical protein
MRQRGQMRCRQVPVVILDFVQMLDQQIARAPGGAACGYRPRRD